MVDLQWLNTQFDVFGYGIRDPRVKMQKTEIKIEIEIEIMKTDRTAGSPAEIRDCVARTLNSGGSKGGVVTR